MTKAAATQAELGLAVWLRPGEQARLERLERFLAASGLRHLRLGVSWADCYTAGGFAWYGSLLERLSKHVELLPCVLYTPPSIGLAPATSAPPSDPKAYADFLDVLVTRHGHCFEWIELWNEPNNLNDWDWRLDPEWKLFCRMIGGAAFWMRRRGKKTVLGGACPTDPPLFAHLAENGVLDHIDAVGVHAFPSTWTPNWRGWAEEIAPLLPVLEACETPPALWITEVGYSTWRHDELRQIEVFAEAAQAPAARVYWYTFDDLDPALSSQEGFHFDERHYHCGLVHSDGRPKLLGRVLADEGAAGVAAAAERFGRPRLRAVDRPVLVTGGAGFLGANLVDRLAALDRQVIVYDNLGRAGVEANLDWLRDRHPKRVVPLVADIRDRSALREAVAEASAVVHLAAQVAVTTSLDDPVDDFEVNLGATLGLLEAVRARSEPPPLLFASTNKVYGALLDAEAFERTSSRYQPRDPDLRRGFDERTRVDLHTPYGCSKGAADQYVLDYARSFGLRTAVFRMSCLYGPRQFGTEDQGWVAHFALEALRGEPVTVFGDGRQVRDILDVADAVDAYLLALRHIDRISGRAFNLGGGPARTVSLIETINLLERITGRRLDVRHGAWRTGDQLWYVSDTTALEAATGWSAKVDPETGLGRLVGWLRTLVAARSATPELREVSA